MTCREKLKLEHPERVRSDMSGGCNGCPSDYGYLEDPKECYSCEDCWDREIPMTPEEFEAEVHEIYKTSKRFYELHERLESLMMKTLRALGYEKGIDVLGPILHTKKR